MYMKLIGGISWNELSVWMSNCRREQRLDLDCVKNTNKISTNKKQAK